MLHAVAPTIDIAVPVVPSTRGVRSGHIFCSVRYGDNTE